MSADQNPYEPPQTDDSSQEQPSQKFFGPLAIPAIGLMFCGAFWLAPLLIFFMSVSQAKIDPPRNGYSNEYIESFDQWWPLWIASFFSSCAMVFGASQMARKRNYQASLAGAIAAIIPLSPCFALTIPFGIWAFILLRKEKNRKLFTN